VGRLVKGTGARHSLIPLFNDPNTVFRVLEYYQPDILHFCDCMVSNNGGFDDLGRLVELQHNIRQRFPEVELMRSIPTNPINSNANPSQTQPSCFKLGPFLKDSELALVKTQLRNPSLQIKQENSTEEQQLTGIWVYIPPAATAETARQKSKQLSADGIKEFSVVNKGEFNHAISLGLYSKPANAEIRVAELKAKGHPEVTVQERHKTTTHHWIVVSLPPDKEHLLSAFTPKKPVDCP